MPPRFRYMFDPLCIGSLLLYAANRFLLKPHFRWSILHEHLNDLLCIPVWVPVGLLIERLLRLRNHDRPPELGEVIIPAVLWGWIFEVYLPTSPLGRNWSTADPLDIACYLSGAVGAMLFWHRKPSAVHSDCTTGQPGSI